VCKLCALMSWTTLSPGLTSVLFFKIRQSHRILSESMEFLKTIFFDKMAGSQRWEIKIQPKFYPSFSNICPICAKKFDNFQSLEVP
jgi:hypothetical protein